MFVFKRITRVLDGTSQPSGDRLFRMYFGSVLHENQGVGPSADEARRDLSVVRQTINRTRIY